MPRFLDCVQGSPEWFSYRAGHATASRFGEILAGKGAREAYLYELVAERLAGPMRDSGGMAKEWGHESEGLARRAYQVRTGHLVRQVGFALHDRIKWCGASADGLVGDDGFIEVKSPFNSGIHARTLARGMLEIHFPQVQGNAWILQRRWGMFISYDPAFGEPHDLYMQRIERDDVFIKHLEAEVKKFLAEVAIATNDLKNSNHNKD
jgi:hypothetical protein